MLEKEVKDWLAEYKGLSSSEIHTFACTISVNDELILALHTLFETPPYHVQELDPVCHQLYEFYRSKETKLQLFALQFVPTLTWLYLRCLSHGDKKVCGGAETFLLGVYNLEIVKTDGTPVVENFRIPTINKASIYHETRASGVMEQLTEHALRKLNPSYSLWRSGPFPQHERFNAQNRFGILAFVMQSYNNHIDSFNSHSLNALCTATIRLCGTGFGKPQDSVHPQPRIALFPSLLVELMIAVYFAMFNGHKKAAVKAVETTHHRACYDIYSDVLLVTNAMLNSHHRGNFKYEGHEVSIGAQKTAQALKNTITNASFKAKKLPDDIEIVEEEEGEPRRLTTVDEEQEHTVAKTLKAKLMNIGGKLGVDKNKNREAMRRDSDTPSVKSGSGGGYGSDVTDSINVAVKNPGSGSSKVVVDMLEMQPMNNRRGSGSGEDLGEAFGSGDKTWDGRHAKNSPSPLVFSKKSGISKQGAGNSSGLLANSVDSSHKAPGLAASSSSAAAASLSTNSVSVNGKATSSSSSSISGSSNSVNSAIKQPPQTTKTNPTRAQSEGPVIREVSNLSAVKSPPSSSPSILSSSSQSNAKKGEATLHSNSSEPVLLNSSSPRPSASTHSMPTEAMSNNSSKPSQKPLVNRNSYSTDL